MMAWVLAGSAVFGSGVYTCVISPSEAILGCQGRWSAALAKIGWDVCGSWCW
jgi:hypothetical protein